ncbi:hypothetical protein BDW75DRAFT_232745 [Aspergillus navahoensis]
MVKVASSTFLTGSHLIPTTRRHASKTGQSSDNPLFIVVNEYRGDWATPGVTLLLTHGTSFCKELWEPLVDFWLRKGSPLPISVVYALDAANHGDSGVVNEKHLGSSTPWPDHSKDILDVVDYLGATKPLIAIGHSFGGGTLAHASTMAPAIFDATILVEPILFQMKEQTAAIAKLVMKRREKWNNLDEACTAIRDSKGFSDWTPDQRERYAVFATRTKVDASGAFRTLKTTKEQESATYLASPHPDIIDILFASHEPHYYIIGGKSAVLNNECQATLHSLGQIHGGTRVIKDGGHLLPMTHPVELAKILEEVILEAMTRIGNVRAKI